MMLDFIFLLPELYFFFCFCCIILYTGLMYYKQGFSVIMNCIFLLVYGGVFYLYILINGPCINVSLISFHMCIDNLIFLVKIICVGLFIFILGLMFIVSYNNKTGSPEPVLLLSLFFLGSALCVMSNDFFIFFLLMEFITIISYLLACLHKFSVFSGEASLKYFILGALSSGFILLGFIILYGLTGLTNLFDFSLLFNLGYEYSYLGFGLLASVILIICGFLFKLAVVPFHIWVVDVYDGVMLPVVLLFSTMAKIVFITVFSKILWFVFYDFYWLWYFILFFCGLLSILLGSIGGLLQTSIVRLYAYSTIVNGGFFCCFLSLGSIEGLIFLYNYLIIYILTSMALFFVLVLFSLEKNIYTHGQLYLSHLPKIALNVSMLPVFVFVLVFFSYAGIPPLSGFLGKFFLFYTFYKQSGFLLIFLLILFITVLTSVYYVRCIYMMLFFQEKPTVFFVITPRYISLGLVIFFLSFFFFIFFQPTILLYLQGVFYTVWL